MQCGFSRQLNLNEIKLTAKSLMQMKFGLSRPAALTEFLCSLLEVQLSILSKLSHSNYVISLKKQLFSLPLTKRPFFPILFSVNSNPKGQCGRLLL